MPQLQQLFLPYTDTEDVTISLDCTLNPAVCLCTSDTFPCCRHLKCMLDFRLSLERAPFLAVDPTCSLAQLTILTLRPSQKGMKALLGGGAAEKLPKTGWQPVTSPARMVRPHSSPLHHSRAGIHPKGWSTSCKTTSVLHGAVHHHPPFAVTVAGVVSNI